MPERLARAVKRSLCKEVPSAQSTTRFDRVLLLNGELVAEGLPAEVLREGNLSKAFGSALLVTEGRTLLVDECCGGAHEGHSHNYECEDQP